MKEKDKGLLSLLRQNARMSVTDLSRRLGVSRTTVQQRLSRLEESGAISGYTLRLGPSLAKSRIQAHVNLRTEPRSNQDIVRALEKITVIDTLYTVSGKIDLIAIINVDSAMALDQTLDRVSVIPGIISTETAIILNTKFDRH